MDRLGGASPAEVVVLPDLVHDLLLLLLVVSFAVEDVPLILGLELLLLLRVLLPLLLSAIVHPHIAAHVHKVLLLLLLHLRREAANLKVWDLAKLLLALHDVDPRRINDKEDKGAVYEVENQSESIIAELI